MLGMSMAAQGYVRCSSLFLVVPTVVQTVDFGKVKTAM